MMVSFHRTSMMNMVCLSAHCYVYHLQLHIIEGIFHISFKKVDLK
jgi:hypothetical protein